MKFELILEMDDAEQEAVWLQDYLQEQRISGLETVVKASVPEEGSMDGGIYEGVISGLLSGGVLLGIEAFFKAVWQHFDGKRARFVLEGECPKGGKRFKMEFDNASEMERMAAQKEFSKHFKKICKGK